MTKVVNIYKEKYDIYIGRPGKNQDGYFGNPVALGKLCPICQNTHIDRGSTLPCYKKYFESRLQNDNEFKSRIFTLRGKTLGCFCAPLPCHGNVIAEYLENHID